MITRLGEKPIITQQEIVDFKRDPISIYHYLKEAKKFYPNFYLWYFTNVLPAIKNGDKEILKIEDKTALKGLAIIKYSEKKLCNLTVMPEYRNRGLGIRLFKMVFEKLETDKPFFTISDQKLPEFQRIFDYFGFEKSFSIKNYYRYNNIEHFYNRHFHFR